MRKLSQIPQGIWFTGARRSDEDVDGIMKRAGGRGQCRCWSPTRSRGVPAGAKGYQRWIDGFADGIGAQRAIVILEPDALPRGCGARALGPAVKRLERAKLPSCVHRRRPLALGPGRDDGEASLPKVHAHAFSLNVSNFSRTEELAQYGAEISAG